MGNWLSICNCLRILNNSQENKARYDICVQLKQEEKASDIT